MSEPAANSPVISPKHPYPPSWIDRLIAWIDNLPISAFVFYAIVFFLTALLSNIILWLDGTLPLGSIDPLETSASIVIIYWLALYHYLTRVGSVALRSFRPLLDADDSEVAKLDYELATLPRSLGRWAIILGLFLQAATILGDPASFGNPANAYYFAGNIIFLTFVMFTFFALVIRSIRQLRMVSGLHDRATNLYLLDLAPAHAFAAFTSRAGIGIILILIIGYVYQPNASFNSALDVFLYIAISMLAIVIFVGPLAGMRARLEDAKDRALSEVNTLLRTATERLHRKISDDDSKNIREATAAISSLVAERDLLQKTSTWPWDTRTLRGFASTLLLPIFLLLFSQFIERFF